MCKLTYIIFRLVILFRNCIAFISKGGIGGSLHVYFLQNMFTILSLQVLVVYLTPNSVFLFMLSMVVSLSEC